MSGLNRSDVCIPNKPKIISKLNLVNHDKYLPTYILSMIRSIVLVIRSPLGWAKKNQRIFKVFSVKRY